MGRLDGKVALITGAGGGLGRGMALAFAREGAAVVCQDLREDTAQETADALTALGGAGVLAWACDVTDSAAVEQMVEAASEQLGVIDVLVSNAGVANTPGDGHPRVAGIEQLAAMTDEAWRLMLEIHVTGGFNCSRAVVRRLIQAERGGSLIFMSSIVGIGGAGSIHYATAKAALQGLMRSIARNGGPKGIRANAIAPGMISTPMTDALPDDQEWVRRRTPLGRIGTVEDVASLALYLAADESGFVTGQTISPNGGMLTS
jgi:3-oxoacyl-[acyl-carrier protein] reductase